LTHKKTPHCGVFLLQSRSQPGEQQPITWQQMRQKQVQKQEQQQMRQQQGLEQPQELEQQEQRLLLFCRKRTKQQQR
jgi:hypothetical protein